MIASLLLAALLLLLACALFVLLALRYRGETETVSRDQLNKRFYQRRLHELAHDEREGVVSERAQHIEDLRRALLTDIPAAPAQSPLPRWVLIPGGAVAGGGAGAVWPDRRSESGTTLAADG